MRNIVTQTLNRCAARRSRRDVWLVNRSTDLSVYWSIDWDRSTLAGTSRRQVGSHIPRFSFFIFVFFFFLFSCLVCRIYTWSLARWIVNFARTRVDTARRREWDKVKERDGKSVDASFLALTRLRESWFRPRTSNVSRTRTSAHLYLSLLHLLLLTRLFTVGITLFRLHLISWNVYLEKC